MARIRTPCIGVCSTGLGDSVCRGCKRFEEEVVNWNAYSLEQKQAIDARLELLLTSLIKARFTIVDEARFRAALDLQRIRHVEYRNPYCWIFDLLKAGASQIDNPADYGLELHPAYRHIPLRKQLEEIDMDFFTLSEAHFERYISGPVKSLNK